RQPFGTGGLLLQILKRGHDPALDFQDNLRRIRSFRRCACVGEYRVKSVRQVTLRWFCGGGGSRRWRAAERARTKCGASGIQFARQRARWEVAVTPQSYAPPFVVPCG